MASNTTKINRPISQTQCRRVKNLADVNPWKMENTEIEKSKSLITVEIIEYVPDAVVIKTIIKKSTGNISLMSFDSGKGLTERTIPFDTFAQIIDGMAEIVIDGHANLLATGQSIVIPAHSPSHINPNGRFKMIMTVIKSA